MLEKYNFSLVTMITSVYKEKEWLPWKFQVASQNKWENIESHKKFLEVAAKELKIKEMSDWYNVGIQVKEKLSILCLCLNKDLHNLGATRALVDIYKSSMFNFLSAVYPEYNWLPWKFNRIVGNLWEDAKILKQFMDLAGKELGIKEMGDWYNVTHKVDFFLICRSNSVQQIIDLKGGKSLLLKHNTILSILSIAYPENEWLPWKFASCPKGFWDDTKNHRKFTDWAARQLNFKRASDWYNLTNKVVFSLVFFSLS
jgi:hypothetical protein